MNFLAHLALSGNNHDRMVGNFIADFVKGKQAMQKFEPGIVQGIELHRMIDAFTDTHPVVAQSKNRLRPTYRHYSGVITDVFYDHYLAKNWNDYSDEPLAGFAERSYRIIESYHAILPQEVKIMLPHMIRGNWLVNYGKLEGIERALTGMAQRTTFRSRMEEATGDLVKHYSEFEKEFRLFFLQLREYCRAKIESLDHR